MIVESVAVVVAVVDAKNPHDVERGVWRPTRTMETADTDVVASRIATKIADAASRAVVGVVDCAEDELAAAQAEERSGGRRLRYRVATSEVTGVLKKQLLRGKRIRSHLCDSPLRQQLGASQEEAEVEREEEPKDGTKSDVRELAGVFSGYRKNYLNHRHFHSPFPSWRCPSCPIRATAERAIIPTLEANPCESRN